LIKNQCILSVFFLTT